MRWDEMESKTTIESISWKSLSLFGISLDIMDKNDIIDNIDNNGDSDNERTKISFDNSNRNCSIPAIPATKSSGGIKSCQVYKQNKSVSHSIQTLIIIISQEIFL